jgi:hypothetical protein
MQPDAPARRLVLEFAERTAMLERPMNMIRILAAGTVLLGLAGAAVAATPADQQACNAMADQLAEAAENKAMDNTQIAEVGGMLVQLMTQCEDNKLAEAGQTADRIRAAIGG